MCLRIADGFIKSPFRLQGAKVSTAIALLTVSPTSATALHRALCQIVGIVTLGVVYIPLLTDSTKYQSDL